MPPQKRSECSCEGEGKCCHFCVSTRWDFLCLACPSFQCYLAQSDLTFQGPIPLVPGSLQPQARPGHPHHGSYCGSVSLSPLRMGLWRVPTQPQLFGCSLLDFPGLCLASRACSWRYVACSVEVNRILKRTSYFQVPSNIPGVLFTHLRVCSRHSRLFIKIGPLSDSPSSAEVALSHLGTRAGISIVLVVSTTATSAPQS
jgi:hypothetical protein